MPATAPSQCVPPLVVALDLGTSSARAILYDGLGRRVEGIESRAVYGMDIEAEGGAETSADALLEITFQIIDELLARASPLLTASGMKIEAVSVSTFWHSLIGVDSQGRAITPLFGWNDTRAAAVTDMMRRELDERTLHARTGCVIHASYWPAKLVWLSRTRPELVKRVNRWISIGEYLYLRLFGKTVCSISMASATGLFNQNARDWDREILSYLKLSTDRMSPLGDMDDSIEGLDARNAGRWPALLDARWFPSLGDGACNNIGTGCTTRQRAALMIGTSGAMRVLWEADAVTIPRGLWCYRADGRRFVMGGALSSGGNVYAWARDTLRLGHPEEVEEKIAAMKADGHGLTVLPFLAGERSTGWVSDALAAIAGISMETTPVDILRACLEAVAFGLAGIYDLLVEEFGELREVIASGGALLRSPAWTQIISDVMGIPLMTSAEGENSSRGAALMALEALGASASIDRGGTLTDRVYSPDPQNHISYVKARERRQRLYESLIQGR